jgi:hypothetical protein
VRSKLDSVVVIALLIVLFSWLLYSAFWVFHTFSYWWVIPFMHDVFTEPAYLSFSFGMILRVFGVLTAIGAAGSFLSSGWSSRTAKLVMVAAILEGVYLVSYLPAAGVGPQTNDYVTTIESSYSTIVQALIVPIPLFILGLKLKKNSLQVDEVLKWGSIAGGAYVFVLWIRFTVQWIATFVATGADFTFYDPGAGFGYVMNYPVNMMEFLLTTFGLLILALVSFWVLLPLIRKVPGAKPNLRGIGLVLTLLGGYFILVMSLYAVLGPVGGLSLFTDYFHNLNVDRWMVVLPVLGVPLMLYKKNSK